MHQGTYEAKGIEHKRAPSPGLLRSQIDRHAGGFAAMSSDFLKCLKILIIEDVVTFKEKPNNHRRLQPHGVLLQHDTFLHGTVPRHAHIGYRSVEERLKRSGSCLLIRNVI